MSVEGVGILAGLFGLPFIIAVALLGVAAKVLVVTAAGTVVAVSGLMRGATSAAVALAKTGYRVYQETQDANALENAQIADNYVSVRASVQSRRMVESSLKNTQSSYEFTQGDRDALSAQLALETTTVESLIRRPASEWKVPVLPTTIIDFSATQQINAGLEVEVSKYDIRHTFRQYCSLLSSLFAQMKALAPTHALTSEIDQLLNEATAQDVSDLDPEYVNAFVEQTVLIHTKCAELLSMAEKRTKIREKVVNRANEILGRITQAQSKGMVYSPNLRMYVSQLTQVLQNDDLGKADTLLSSIDTELKKEIRQHTDLMYERLKLFFADMVHDMQTFAEMVLIDAKDVDSSSPAEREDARRRDECTAWIAEYHAFMEDVAGGHAYDIEGKRDLLELKANALRDKSINMSEEIQHGLVAGLFRGALDELGFTAPPSSGPVQIYKPIIGFQGNKMVSFQLSNDGTFTFTSEGFGDAECKVVYDQVLSLLQKYGMRFASVHKWTQAKAANVVITALQKISRHVQITERNGNLILDATTNEGESVRRVIDVNGKTIEQQGNIPSTNPNAHVRRPGQLSKGVDPLKQRVK